MSYSIGEMVDNSFYHFFTPTQEKPRGYQSRVKHLLGKTFYFAIDL